MAVKAATSSASSTVTPPAGYSKYTMSGSSSWHDRATGDADHADHADHSAGCRPRHRSGEPAADFGARLVARSHRGRRLGFQPGSVSAWRATADWRSRDRRRCRVEHHSPVGWRRAGASVRRRSARRRARRRRAQRSGKRSWRTRSWRTGRGSRGVGRQGCRRRTVLDDRYADGRRTRSHGRLRRTSAQVRRADRRAFRRQRASSDGPAHDR